ncbi:MAG: ABC transporter permease [Clostridiales bacterium]|nr:ABC transporter permease [Clostridiales bacterium]
MWRYVVKRILMMIPILLVVLILVFVITHYMPGDPVRVVLGSNYTEEQYIEMSQQMGLDKPLIVQFGNYLYDLVFNHSFGDSYLTSRPVTTELAGRIQVSIRIGLLSCILTTCIAIPVGIISAVNKNSILDYIISTLSIVIAALPNFWVALMCIIIFCLRLGWLPATATTSWTGYILPVVCNGTMALAIVTRQTRSSMLDVVRQDYMRTARAKGLSSTQTVIRHGLKNAMLPVLATLGTQFSMIVGGSVVIENIFSVPGMGGRLVTAINQRDCTVVLAIVFIISAFSMCILLLVDILFGLVDPRVKAQFAGKARRKKPKKAVVVEETANQNIERKEGQS